VSKGRRILIAAGIALGVAFGVQMGAAQGPSAQTPVDSAAAAEWTQTPSPSKGTAAAKKNQSPSTPQPPAEPSQSSDKESPGADTASVDPFKTAQESSQSSPVIIPKSPDDRDGDKDGTARAPRIELPSDSLAQSQGEKPTRPSPKPPDDSEAEKVDNQKTPIGGRPLPLPEERVAPISGEKTLDELVQPAQAPASGATPRSDQEAGVGGAGGPAFPRPETLPVGPHAVGLTVEARAVSPINLNTRTNLYILIRNHGTTDAQGVMVYEPLPEGLEFIDSTPKTTSRSGSLLVWNLGVMPANAEKQIKIVVKCIKKVPVIDHAAYVTLQTGGRARVVVREPKLSIVANPSSTRVLKGQQVRFDITVTNTGDGPARDVIVKAKLGPGLRHDSGSTIELPFKLLQPPRQSLSPQKEVQLELVVDAVGSGDQTCEFSVVSPDVADGSPETHVAQQVQVTEPKLALKVKASAKRYVGSLASFHLILENTGSATAKRVQADVALPATGGSEPTDTTGEWNSKTHRLFWNVGNLDPGQVLDLPFTVRVGGEQIYRVDARAKMDGLPAPLHQSASTTVSAIANVVFGVREPKDVVDVGEKTIFTIKMRNDGSAEAHKIYVHAELSEHLQIVNTTGLEGGQQAMATPDKRQITFPTIDRLAPNEELVLTIQVAAVKPGHASCQVGLVYDESDNLKIQHTEPLKVTDPSEPEP
jgi:uncharacterized repeat protein (TIGR01451 family)